MDDTDWTATGLFSPSKAKLAQAQAKDWNFIDAWLTKKYVSSRVPSFERNEETLEALLTLISLNEAADERRHVVERVEKSALQFLTKQKSEPGDALLRSITDHLYQPGHDSIETLAQVSLLLNSPIKDGGLDELYASAIDLQMQSVEIEHIAATSAKDQIDALKAEHERLIVLLAELKSDAYKPPPTVVEDTAQWTRGTKHLRAKIGEYDERLTATRPAQSLLTLIDEVREAAVGKQKQQAQLADVEDELKALRNFPLQQAAAKKLLVQAKESLQVLLAERDGLMQQYILGSCTVADPSIPQ